MSKKHSTNKPRNHRIILRRRISDTTPEEELSAYLREGYARRTWYNRYIRPRLSVIWQVPLSIIVITLLTAGIILLGVLTVGISAVLFVSSLSMMGAAMTMDELRNVWRRLWNR